MTRRGIVGIMGANGCSTKVEQDVILMGGLIRQRGLILLTGGSGSEKRDVKCAAIRGVRQRQNTGEPERAIGIIGDGPRRWDCRNCPALLFTGLGGIGRDPITGVTPDSLIFTEGSSGTLTELSFATLAKKPVFFWKAKKTLQEKFKKHSKGELQHTFLRGALESAHNKLQKVKGVTAQTTVGDLNAAIAAALTTANDFAGSLEELIVTIANTPAVAECPEDTDFAGFRDDADSINRFNDVVREISK